MKEKIIYIILRIMQWFIIIITWIIFIALHILMLVVPFAIIIIPLFVLLIRLYIFIKHKQFDSMIQQNVIVHGGRGKGKGLLFQFSINRQEKVLSNVPFGSNTKVINPKEYFNSIRPNESMKMISGEYTKVNKILEWEKVPYYLDDTAVYFPNYNDNELKKLYPSMSLFIPIQRHIYDSYTVINVQDIERTYKILRELQTDGYIKALEVIGKGYISKRIPILRKYFVVKYRYHEQLESAKNNVLPFEKMGLVQKATDGIYKTTPSALKDIYNGQNGIIKDGFVFIKKKHIKYDTRYFHELLFGYKS